MESVVGIVPAVDAVDAKEQQQACELQVDVNVQPEAEEEGEDAQQTRDLEEEPAEPVKEAEVAVVVDEIVADVVAASEQSEDDVAPVVADMESVAEPAAFDADTDVAATTVQSEEAEEEGGADAEPAGASPSEACTTEETTSETTMTTIETTETKTTVTKTASVDATVVESTTTEVVKVGEIVSEEVVEVEAATEDATSSSSTTKETAVTAEENVAEKVATETAVVEEIVSAASLDTEIAIEPPTVEVDVGVVAVVEESFAGEVTTETASEEVETSDDADDDVVVESATAEEVSTEKAVVDEVAIEAEVGEQSATVAETSTELQETTAAVIVAEAASVVTEDSLSREVAEVVANAVVESIIAEVVASVDDAALAESLAPRAISAEAVEEATLIPAAAAPVEADNAEEIHQELIISLEHTGELLEDAARASNDRAAEVELAQTSDATQHETEDQAEATGGEESSERASNTDEKQVNAESVEDKADAVGTLESGEVESVADAVATPAPAASVEIVATETKLSGSPDQPSQRAEVSTVALDDEPNAAADVPSSSRSVSSDEEGWRSDDNDSVDGGDGSKKKKSRAFRSPVRSMISRFANKVSSSMPKKRLGAHRTESAARLELESPSPVHGAVTRLESPHEEKVETHRTESAAKLDLEGNSPVKHIVHRFESPQHNSLDNLKIRTVRTFFDEKERSIHVDQEKEKYDSALKSVAEGEATPTKASPTARKTVKPSPKAPEDAAPAKVLPPASPAPAGKSAEESKEVESTIDTSTVTPVKNMVSRFEKKPEQSLDNLSFRTVRTFFPTIEEPSIRVGAEKQKYEAVTEQQKAEARRLEEEKIAKTKASIEPVAAVVETASTSEPVEEEHVLHVRDLAHQLEARSSLTRDLAPVSLSRSSSGASERAEAVRTRLARSISNSSDRSSVSGSAAPPSLSRTTSASSDRPPRFVSRSQSDASSHHGETSSAEFHVKDVAQQFESRIPPSPQNAAAPARRSSAAEVTLSAAHSQLRRTSVSSAKDVHVHSEEKAGEEEVFNVKSMAHRFESASLSRQSSGVDSTPTPTHVSAATPPRFRRNSSQGSASSAPLTPAPATPVDDHATPKQVQVTANAVLETTPSANVRDIAHRFETNRAQSVETPAYRTMETFFNEVDEPSIRVGAEKAKLEALEKQKELEAKLAWAKSLHAEEEAAAAAAAAAKKAETLHWFLMPAATNPAFVRLHSVLTDRDPMTALALFPRQEPSATETDSDLQIPLIPMDLPPFA